MKSRGNRDQVVVITKVGSDMGQGKKDLSAAYIEKAAEASLKRLQVEAIDLYLSHWPDPSTPYDETLGAYEKLLKAGKVRYVGASNLDAGQLEAALKVASQKKLPRYDVLQPEYNLYDRAELRRAVARPLHCRRRSASSPISASPRASCPASTAARPISAKARAAAASLDISMRAGLRILAALDAVSARHSATQAEVALAWVIARPGITAPISSATTEAQVDSLIRAVSLKLSAADIAELDKASA